VARWQEQVAQYLSSVQEVHGAVEAGLDTRKCPLRHRDFICLMIQCERSFAYVLGSFQRARQVQWVSANGGKGFTRWQSRSREGSSKSEGGWEKTTHSK
jgi:hypothetical protein